MAEQMIRRGDIVMAPFGKDQFLPVIVLSDGLYNQRSGTIIAVPLFKDRPTAGFPLSYALAQPIENIQYWAKPGHIKTFSSLSLGYVIGRAENADLKEILVALSEIIGNPIS